MNSSIARDQDIETKSVRPKPVWRIFLPSLTTIALVSYFIISLRMNGDFRPFIRRGFFCNDSSINYPFKSETINIKVLMLVALIIPGIVIKMCDRNSRKLLSQRSSQSVHMKNIRPKRRKISGDLEELDVEEEELINPQISARRRLVVNDEGSDYETLNQDPDLFTPIPIKDDYQDEESPAAPSITLYKRSFGDFQLFFFGICTTMLVTGIGKLTCGRLRPHFMQRCVPDVDCSKFTDDTTYVQEFNCTNTQLRPQDMSYITTSWPSGHASIMFYSMTYLIVYLNSVVPIMLKLREPRVPRRFSPLMLYSIYVLMIGLAGYIAGTRVSDYHHHALDVFSGSVIGTVIALALSRSIPKRNALSIS